MTETMMYLQLLASTVLYVFIQVVDGDNYDLLFGRREDECRDRSGYYKTEDYKLITCASCFAFLIRKSRYIKYNPKQPRSLILLKSNSTGPFHYTLLVPDFENQTLSDRICSYLRRDQCQQWRSCCQAALSCCHEQKRHKVPRSRNHCPRTWDGFACWSDTPSDVTVSTPCPSFIDYSMPSERAFKTCTSNGTWYERADSEWTDYTVCLDLESHKIKIYVIMGCLSGSLLLLIPSVIIFIIYRSLRTQHRIRLHLNLFVSFVFTCGVFLLWYTLIAHDRLVTPTQETVMYRNMPWCKLVYVLTRYAQTTNYMWMLCEAFYLHRLIVNAFEPPKSLLAYYLVGWGFPWLPVIIYTTKKLFHGRNQNCWLENVGNWEWIIYTPNLLSLLINLVFLCNILRILLTQLQTHPNEPSNYRRAFKATFILVPLFGLQLFAIMYRPSPLAAGYKVYDILSGVLIFSQGFFVSLIFCLLNGEVITHLRRSVHRHFGMYETRGIGATTQFLSENNTNSNKNVHVMSLLNRQNGQAM